MGIFIAAVTSDPVIGVSCSFCSHYLLDIVPHEPEEELFYVPGEKNMRNDEIKSKLARRRKSSIADLLFSVLLIASFIFFSGYSPVPRIAYLFIIVFFSLLPDILTIIYLKYPIKILSKHYDLHFKIHKLIPLHMSYFTATSYQVIFAVALVYLALRLG